MEELAEVPVMRIVRMTAIQLVRVLEQDSYRILLDYSFLIIIVTDLINHFMKKKNKNEELQSRRQFFKKSAKGALPILGALLLPQVFKSFTASAAEMGCKGYCSQHCSSGCKSTCSGNCAGGCKGTCQGGCERSCGGTCRRGCSSGCARSSY